MAPQRNPERMCLGCNKKRPKGELVRVVRSPEGEIILDVSGKAKGRGAYLCPHLDCLNQAAKGKRLERALRSAIPKDLLAELEARFTEESHLCK